MCAGIIIVVIVVVIITIVIVFVIIAIVIIVMVLLFFIIIASIIAFQSRNVFAVTNILLSCMSVISAKVVIVKNVALNKRC